jgi:TRAP-type C4-dicarboxylate transport system permease small subunit
VKNLSGLSRTTERIVQTISNILLILILVLVFAEVVARYVFHESRGFMEAFSTWAQVWIIFLMVGVVEKRRQQVVVDVIPRRLPKKYQTALLITLDVIAIVFCVLLFVSGVETAQNWSFLGYSTGLEFAIPMWIVVLCTPLGAIFYAFFAIENLIIDILSLGQSPAVKSNAHP